MDIRNSTLPTRLASRDFAHGAYFVSVAPGVTPAEVIDPDFWQHVCQPPPPPGRPAQRYKLVVGDLIEVVAQDGSFDMDLRVVAVDARGLWAQVRVLRYVGEGAEIAVPGMTLAPRSREAEPLDPDGYRVEFAGPHKFRIVRGNDVLETHLPTKAAAYAKLAEIKAEKVAA